MQTCGGTEACHRVLEQILEMVRSDGGRSMHVTSTASKRSLQILRTQRGRGYAEVGVVSVVYTNLQTPM
jgi:hypothetical protein